MAQAGGRCCPTLPCTLTVHRNMLAGPSTPKEARLTCCRRCCKPLSMCKSAMVLMETCSSDLGHNHPSGFRACCRWAQQAEDQREFPLPTWRKLAETAGDIISLPSTPPLFESIPSLKPCGPQSTRNNFCFRVACHLPSPQGTAPYWGS